MKELVFDKPNPKQEIFLRARQKYVGYGGARGGGKSWAVRTKAKLLALKYPGIAMLVIRKSYPELVSNHIRTLKVELHGVAQWHEREKSFVFANGSRIDFGYCACDSDMDRYQGAEYDVIFLDEAVQLRQEWVEKFTACCRGVNEFPKRVYYTMNPGGASHAYFKRLFIDRRFEGKENPDDYVFIQAKVKDNAALMQSQPDYIEQLEVLPPRLRQMWLDGDWNVYSGQFFEEFRDDPEHYRDRQYTHVIEPFDIPEDWNIYRSYDFGYAKPFSCGWWAIDHNGVAYRILELYGCVKGSPNEGVKWNAEKQFKEIYRIEQEHPWLKGKKIRGVADPAIWDASRGESVNETAMRCHVYFDPGDNKRIPGWLQVHYRMAFDDNGYPMLYVFNNCKEFIRTMPMLMYDENKPEDLDTDMEDHIADETRYFCMSRPIKPRAKVEKLPPMEDPLNQRTAPLARYDYFGR